MPRGYLQLQFENQQLETNMQRIKKASTHKGRKFLVDREPKIVENTKQCVFLQRVKGSEILNNCMKDLYRLKAPDAVRLSKKSDLHPFETTADVEYYSRYYDASLMFFGSHSKKRPNELTLCRMFDHEVLDMVELGIKEYRGLSEFKNEKIATGLKPCLVFAGPIFEQNNDFKRIQNMLIDFFQREEINNIRLQGLEHVLMFTATEDTLYMRSYRILLKKSGCKTPRIELEELGPSIDFTVGRNRFASDTFFKQACKLPTELKVKKVKNVSRDVFGSKLGRIHVGKQNIHDLQTRKMKGLRKSVTERRRIRANKEKKGQKKN